MALVFPPLYAILDAALLQTSEPALLVRMARELAESGVELLQVRDKRATARQLFESCLALSKSLLPLPGTFPQRLGFIVNDRPDVALLSGAGGVHVGQQDLGVEEARAVVGPERWVGISTHTLEQVDAAERTSADYVAFGPIYATSTKERHDPVVGLSGLAAARSRTSKSLVAIGGITVERAAEVYAAGADSLAVAHDLLTTGSPGARAQAFLEVAGRTSRASKQPGATHDTRKG